MLPSPSPQIVTITLWRLPHEIAFLRIQAKLRNAVDRIRMLDKDLGVEVVEVW